MEPLNKGHIMIRSTVPCREAVLISEVVVLCTERFDL